MSAIRMMAVFARRVGMTPQAFHDHWRYPHGSLGQGIRIIKRYVQSHQVDVDFLDADQNRYEGIAEVWFDSEADAAAFVTDPDYVAYALKRSEEPTSELQSLMRISYAVFCLKKKNDHISNISQHSTYISHTLT